MNRKSILPFIGLAAAVAMIPSAANARGQVSVSIGTGGYYSGYGNGWYGNDPYRSNNGYNYRHDRQDSDLANEHEYEHEAVEETHEQAHDQGINRYQDRRLHRELRREHRYGDAQIVREHERQHWQTRDNGYRQDPYYGY